MSDRHKLLFTGHSKDLVSGPVCEYRFLDADQVHTHRQALFNACQQCGHQASYGVRLSLTVSGCYSV